MKILHKYVLKEHLGPLIFALATLTSLLLLNYIAKQFGNLVGKGIPWTAILEFFGLSIPFTVALTFPMAVLVSTLYAFGRLASENEITALKASGVSLRAVITPVLVAAAIVTVLMVIFNDQVMPRANHQLAILQTDIAQKKPTFSLREQVINEVQPGKFYLRASHIDESSNTMRQVTIYDLSDATRRRTIYADSGDLAMSPSRTDLLLTLFSGTMIDVPTTAPAQLQRLYFTHDYVVVKAIGNAYTESKGGQTKFEREMTVCEMSDIVNAEWKRYSESRRTFLTELHNAQQKKLQLSASIQAVNPPAPPRVRMGTTYCKFLDVIGVPTAGAQAAVPVPNQTAAQSGTQTPSQPPSPSPLPAQPVPTGTDSPSVNSAIESQVPSTVNAPIVDMTPSILEIKRSSMLESQDKITKYNIEIHKKFALAVACFVFVLLGAPIALRFPRGGVGLTIGVSLFVFALYYVGLIAGASLAQRGLIPAWIAMWMANFIFTLAALYLWRGMDREGSTARGGDAGEMWDAIKTKLGRLVGRRRLDEETA